MVSAAAGFAGSAAFNHQAARAVRWHRNRMFESEEYASILNFAGLSSRRSTRQGASANQPSQLFLRRLILENTRAVVLETCVWAEL